MFEKFENRVIISGVLETSTGLHIGSSYARGAESDTDSPVMKDAAGQPIIPGSSFKGALRSTVEKIASGLGMSFCYITSKGNFDCISTNRKLQDELKELQDEFEKEKKEGDEGTQEENMQALLCDVCQLFGSPYMSSRVFIKDLLCLSDDVRYEIRDGVAIDRDSETAGDRLKYDFEVVPSKTRFSFEAVAENITERLLGLLLIGLKQLEGDESDGSAGKVPLGGMKSRGLGWVDLSLSKIEVVDNKGDLLDEEDAKLKSYLIKNRGHVMKKNGDGELKAFIERMINSLLDGIAE